MRRLSFLVAAAFIASATPRPLAAQECTPTTVNGKAACRLPAPMPGESGGTYTARVQSWCRSVGGSPHLDPLWCERTGTGAAVSGTSGQLGSGEIAATAAGLAATGQLDANTAMLAGMDLGVALNNWTKAAQQRAEARRRAQLAALEQRRRAEAVEAERRRNEIAARLDQEFRFTTNTDLQMRLDSTHDQLGLRFDNDTARRDPTNEELMRMNKQNCFFMVGCEKYEMRGNAWDTPYVDVRNLKRAAHLARRTLTSAGDARSSEVEQVGAVAQGAFQDVNIPTEDVRLPPNALDAMISRSATHKLATDERLRADALVATLQERRDFVNGVAEAARTDTSAVSAAKRAEALRRLNRELASLDSSIAAARRQASSAADRERTAATNEGRTLITMLLRGPVAAGGPVEDCAAEGAGIARLRAGLPKLDEEIRRLEAAAAGEHRDARAKIAEAREARWAVYDDVMSSLQGLVEAEIVATRAAAMSVTGLDRSKLYARANALNEKWEEVKGYWDKGTKAGTMLGKAVAKSREPMPDGRLDALLSVFERLDDIGAFSQMASSLTKVGPLAEYKLGPWVKLGETFIRTGSATVDAVLADRRARDLRLVARRLSETRHYYASQADEREQRLHAIERDAGCLAM